MTNRARSLLADIIVGIAIFIVALWFLRWVVGMVLWFASVAALVLVVVALFAFAKWVRGG